MVTHASSPRYRRYLLPVFLGCIILLQACSAVLVQIDTSVSPTQVYLGRSVTVYAHVHATDYPGVKMANVPVKVRISKPSLTSVFVTGTTNASGWASLPYTPDETGMYGTTGFATVDFSTIPGLPTAGVQNYPVSPPLLVAMNDLNVTAAPPRFIPRTVSTAGLVQVGVTTPAPTAAITSPAPTATSTPPVPPEEQASPSASATTAVPASPPGTLPTVPASAPQGETGPGSRDTPLPLSTMVPVTTVADLPPVTGTPARQAAPLLQPVSGIAAILIISACCRVHRQSGRKK